VFAVGAGGLRRLEPRGGIAVVDAHVVRAVETGDRNPAPTGMRQPYQRLERSSTAASSRRAGRGEWGGCALNSAASCARRPGARDRGAEAPMPLRDRGDRAVADLLPFALFPFVASSPSLASGPRRSPAWPRLVAVFLLAIVPALQRGGDPLFATRLAPRRS
jgi:hypothetical protein